MFSWSLHLFFLVFLPAVEIEQWSTRSTRTIFSGSFFPFMPAPSAGHTRLCGLWARTGSPSSQDFPCCRTFFPLKKILTYLFTHLRYNISFLLLPIPPPPTHTHTHLLFPFLLAFSSEKQGGPCWGSPDSSNSSHCKTRSILDDWGQTRWPS